MKYYFWDSCVLIEYLNNKGNPDKVRNIQAFLDDAKAGKCQIYISSLSIAEILPSQIHKYKSLQNFMEDFNGAFIVVTPNPNIMLMAAFIRDQIYRKTIGKGPSNVSSRKIDTPDAIILASAIYTQKANEIKLDEFHTYDNGKTKNSSGSKTVPILDFNEWCDESIEYNDIVEDIKNLPRRQPLYGSLDLFSDLII